ncbi:MAG: Lrp/AsnC family transcriptional regulator [Caulobacterales bacterium]
MGGRIDRGDLSRHRFPKVFAPSGMRLDSVDFVILRQLQTDARSTYEELGDLVGLKDGAAGKRVRALEETGVIVRHVAEIADQVFEAWSTFLVEVVLTAHGRRNRMAFYEALQAAPEITDATELFGEVDVLLRASLVASGEWGALERRLDPDLVFIERATPRVAGRTIKRLGPHPMLTELGTSTDWIVRTKPIDGSDVQR